MKKIFTAGVFAVGLLFIGVSLLGCSVSVSDENNNTVDRQNVQLDNYSGPYANDFFDNAQKAKNNFILEVLQDSVITDEEFYESRNKYTTCLEDLDYEITLGSNGRETLLPPQSKRANEKAIDADRQLCDENSGVTSIGMLYEQIHANPQNEDFTIIMTDCLKRNELVPDDYTADDFRNDGVGEERDGERHVTGYIKKLMTDGSEKEKDAYMKCQEDPLSLK